MAFTVHAAQGGNTAVGMTTYILVFTGASASQPGATGGSSTRTSASLSQILTPLSTGSFLYASMLSISGAGTISPLSGQSVPYSNTGGGLNFTYVSFTSGTTAGSNVTIGGTNTSNTCISIAAIEIQQKSGQTLAVDASSPGGAFLNNSSITSSSFTPPNGSLIMVALSTNGGSGVTTMAITDTSGLGLTWTEQVKQDPGNNGYVGVWTARMPGGTTTSSTPGVSMMGVG